MRFKTFGYFMKESFSSIFSNKLMSFASTTTIIASLIIFGMFVLFNENFNSMISQIKLEQQIQVFVEDTIDSNGVKEIEQQIKNIEHVTECKLVDKNKRLDEFIDSLEEYGNLFEDFKNDNPLRNSYIIKFDNIEYADAVVEELKLIYGIANISYYKELFDKLISISYFFQGAGFFITILLTFIGILMISNTIKITVFARRKEINIMKFVGATDGFIRWPFIIEGMLIGLIGSIISLILLSVGYNYMCDIIKDVLGIFDVMPFVEICKKLGLSLILFGMFIGAIGSSVSMRKFLRV